ncbi:MAG: DMT family transporter [Chloroflexota bacterium]|nr:DMT family transporter [Chloroflexota bacterium]
MTGMMGGWWRVAVVEPGVLLGVGSAVAWGTGDYAGGLAARRVGGMLATGGAQVAGFVLLLAAVAVLRPDAPATATLVLGALGGIAGGLGLAALYRALAIGAMGLVSAISGVGAVLIPLSVGFLLWGTSIQPLQLAGIALAIAAVAAASGATTRGVSREGLRLALVAALGFGLWFVFLDRASEHDQLWALVASRGSASLLIGGLALLRSDRSELRPVLPLIGVAGVMDAAANGMVVLSFATIPVGISAALSGTYPLVTMLLARVLLREALPRLGVLAVALAVAGIVCISLGG